MARRPSGLVFLTYYNEPFTRVKLSRALNEFKRRNLFKRSWCPMDLRHSFAVNFLVNGGVLREFQRILGHNNVFDTKLLYGALVNQQSSLQLLSPSKKISTIPIATPRQRQMRYQRKLLQADEHCEWMASRPKIVACDILRYHLLH